MSQIDFNWIVRDRIGQGGLKTRQRAVQLAPEIFSGFNILVLCAEEIQPRIKAPPGRAVMRVPLDDDIYNPVPTEAGKILHQCAKMLASHVQNGARILTTCAQGRNRSGLMSALTMMYAFGMSPTEAIRVIHMHRKDSLMNPMFNQWLINQQRSRR